MELDLSLSESPYESGSQPHKQAGRQSIASVELEVSLDYNNDAIQ
jgi:hypothetical protein